MSKVNPYQFHVVAPGYQPKKRGATGSRTERKQRAGESSGKVIVSHPEDGIVGGLTYSHKEWPGAGMGRGVDTVLVDPRHRGSGLADGMYNVASREMGYRLGHSKALTKQGAKFADRVGGPTQTGQPPRPTLRPINIQPDALNTDLLKNDIAHKATPVDPTISRALTPVQESAPTKKTRQRRLPGEDWKKY